MPTTTDGPLSGIRVIDHGHVWAGPLLGMSFKDMGAEVIKIQSPTGGSGVSMAGKGMAGTATRDAVDISDPMAYHAFDRGKKSLSLDLQSEDGKEIYKKLVAVSDVVVENFSARVMPSLDLGFDVLTRVNPKIILASLSATGATDGPWRDLVTYGPSLAALYGIKSVLGYHDSDHPQEDQADLDPTAAGHAFFAILAALESRDATGRGQHIDIAQGEACIQRIAEPLMDYFLNGRVAGPQGNRYPATAPHGYYQTSGSDQWISISVRNQEEWEAFRGLALQNSENIANSKFETLQGRLDNQNELDEAIESWTKDYTAMQLTKILQKSKIPAYPVMGALDLVNDENLNSLHRTNITVKDENFSPDSLYRGVIWKLEKGQGEITGPTPSTGAHNVEILIDLLGYEETQVLEFQRNGII